MSEEISRLRKKLEKHEERISRLEKLLQKEPEVIRKKESIKEFILRKRAINDVQKALAIGYYLEKFRGFSAFNERDLKQGFRDAREKTPQNVADKIQQNIAKGHMMKTGEKKDDITAYCLTNSGARFVEDDFKKEK